MPADPTPHTEPRDISRRLALYPAEAAVQFEVWVTRRRFSFGRNDYFIEPARGKGGKWTKESALEFLEPEQGEESDE